MTFREGDSAYQARPAVTAEALAAAGMPDPAVSEQSPPPKNRLGEGTGMVLALGATAAFVGNCLVESAQGFIQIARSIH